MAGYARTTSRQLVTRFVDTLKAILEMDSNRKQRDEAKRNRCPLHKDSSYLLLRDTARIDIVRSPEANSVGCVTAISRALSHHITR